MMPLSAEDRGMLEKQIDDKIENAHKVVERFRLQKQVSF
jgi:hypothetical protein